MPIVCSDNLSRFERYALQDEGKMFLKYTLLCMNFDDVGSDCMNKIHVLDGVNKLIECPSTAKCDHKSRSFCAILI